LALSLAYWYAIATPGAPLPIPNQFATAQCWAPLASDTPVIQARTRGPIPMTSRIAEEVRCPSCGKKVAESLTGALKVTCPRCGVTFTIQTLAEGRLHGHGD